MTERERRWREAAQQWRDRDCSKCCLQLGCEYSKGGGSLADQELEPWMQIMILKKECGKYRMKPNATKAAE